MYTGSLYIHLGQCIQKIACIQIFFPFLCNQVQAAALSLHKLQSRGMEPYRGHDCQGSVGKENTASFKQDKFETILFFLCSLLCWHSRSSNAQNSPSLQNEFKMSAKKDFGVANKIIIISAKSPHFPGLFHVSNT